MDFEKIAEELIQYSGGAGNISSVTHCMTRLRFIIKDKSKVDLKRINATKPVMGNVFKTNELQIILGQNLMPVYTAAAKLLQDQVPVADMEAAKTETKKKMTLGEAGTAVINFVSAAVTPLVPGLIAGGMLKVFLLLIILVQNNLGIAILPESCKKMAYDKDIIIKDIAENMQSEVFVIWRREYQLSSVARRFLDFVKHNPIDSTP